MESYFEIKVIPLGDNLCLMEEREEGEIKALVEDGCDRLNQWFKEIREWKSKDIDNE